MARQVKASMRLPAEVAFLDAMITAFGLNPQNGVLQGNGTTLDLQVSIPPYRADFVACGWLVVEIDGKAYHSSADAVARDRERDIFMENMNYKVLRIPAKSVFIAPQQVITQVQSAIGEGRPTAKHTPQVGSNTTHKGLLETVTELLGEFNSKVDQIKAVQDAMSTPKITFHLEQVYIDAAIKAAMRDTEIKQWIGNDLIKEKAYYDSRIKLEEVFDKVDKNSRSKESASSKRYKQVVPSMAEPSKHESAIVNEAIENAYRRLIAERSAFLKAKRRMMSEDQNLGMLAKKSLEESGNSSLWQLIAP